MRYSMQVKSTKNTEIRKGIGYSTAVGFNNTDIEALHTIPEINEPPAQICVDTESPLGADIVVSIWKLQDLVKQYNTIFTLLILCRLSAASSQYFFSF